MTANHTLRPVIDELRAAAAAIGDAMPHARDLVLEERKACAALMATLRAKSRNHLFRSALTVAEGEIRARSVPQPPRPTNPYACHNRAPFKPVVAMPDGHSFPFRMAMDCQYTLSALGQQDPRCAGCRWRANLP